MMSGQLFKFHPITKENADDIPTLGLSDSDKAELASMVRAGAIFYWQLQQSGDPPAPHAANGMAVYDRVELANISFVLNAIGVKLELIETQP